MANSPIDALLRVTGPPRDPGEAAISPTNPAKPFEELFNRATQSTAPRNPSRPESASHRSDDPAVLEQRDTDNHSSLPNDSHLHADSEEADPSRTAKTASIDELEDESPQDQEDLVVISGAAASQVSSEEPSSAFAEPSPDGKSSVEGAAPENAGKTDTGKLPTDSTGKLPNQQTANLENQPETAGESLPATPDLTAEEKTEGTRNPAISTGGTATEEVPTAATQKACKVLFLPNSFFFL